MSNVETPKMDIRDTVSLSEAAEMLGLDGFRNVKHLIKKGLLRSYKSKFSNRVRVSRAEVLTLTEVEEVTNG